MHPVSKADQLRDADKLPPATIPQWNSTLTRRRTRQQGRGAVPRREGPGDSKRWARKLTRQFWVAKVRMLYGTLCLHPMEDGTLCGRVGQAHHCRYGGKAKDGDRTDPFNGTIICGELEAGHHTHGEESVHANKGPTGTGGFWRRYWMHFATIAATEGPQAALCWNLMQAKRRAAGLAWGPDTPPR